MLSFEEVMPDICRKLKSLSGFPVKIAHHCNPVTIERELVVKYEVPGQPVEFRKVCRGIFFDAEMVNWCLNTFKLLEQHRAASKPTPVPAKATRRVFDLSSDA